MKGMCCGVLETDVLRTGILSSPLHQVSFGGDLVAVLSLDPFDTVNNEGKSRNRFIHQPTKKRRNDVAILTGQVKMISEFLHGDPPVITPLLLHILLQ